MMKKFTTLWLMIVMLGVSLPSMAAMSISKMRKNARFLTDRMAYELRLSEMQYNDVYEVNYDFINNVRYIMDDVVRGNAYAVDRYYEFLNYRNDDLRWILSSSQYHRFMGVDYFYRPIYTTANQWLFRIYKVYHDVNHFHFKKPYHYKSYKGGHFRTHFGNVSYYKNHRKDHYKHDFYKGKIDVRPHKNEKPHNAPKISNRRENSDVNRKKENPRLAPSEKRPLVKQNSYREDVKSDNRRKETVKVKKAKPQEANERKAVRTR